MQNFNLKKIRHYLHENPELSSNEKNTHDFLVEKLALLQPVKIYKNLGGFGVAAVFGSENPDKTIMFRCDTDALPIREESALDYQSKTKGVAHLCGHDGHMTIMLGFAEKLSQIADRLKNRVVLLFQPAEETARGAKAVLVDPRFTEIEPDLIFGLHNLPGFETHEIILRKGIFASASKGMVFRFAGKTSHAAHPENGQNPALAISQLIQNLLALPTQFVAFNNAALITIIHVKIGDIAFGTSAGEGVVMATFRSHNNADMQTMTKQALKTAQNLANAFDLGLSTEAVEIFASTKNEDKAFEIVAQSAKNLNLPATQPDHPFPWSEDFGFFTEKYNGCFFGIGSGRNHPQLHNHDYDFPDEIITTGINMYSQILKNLE